MFRFNDAARSNGDNIGVALAHDTLHLYDASDGGGTYNVACFASYAPGMTEAPGDDHGVKSIDVAPTSYIMTCADWIHRPRGEDLCLVGTCARDVAYRESAVTDVLLLSKARLAVIGVLPGHVGGVRCIAVPHDDRHHAWTCSGDGTVRVWNVITRTCKIVIKLETKPMCAAASSGMVVVGDDGGNIHIFNAKYVLLCCL